MSGTAVAVSVGLGWLYSTLSGDSTLLGYAPGGVWRYIAPTGTATPYIILQPQSPNDKITMNAIRIFSDDAFQVKAVAPETQFQAMINASNRIDTLINNKPVTTITGGTLLACFRERELEYNEIVNGALWQHMGGLYRLYIE